jgi:hypothetical protein
VSDYKYTRIAGQAASLAEFFEARFEKGLDGPVHFRVALSAPDGPSTGGGKQALQHIKLIPENGGPAVVIGSANTNRMTAEIRTYEHIAALYAQRFHGAKLPIDVTRYYELGQDLATFFRTMTISVTFAKLGGGATTVQAPPAGGRSFNVVLSVALALLVLAVAYVVIFVRR